MKQINREILSIAVPSIVTNITTPLLALMDVVIVGHMGGADYIAAIAVGGTIFNMIYWLFAFLRMGSSGLTAQAYGAGNRTECDMVLQRGLLVVVTASVVMIACQIPIFRLAGFLFEIKDNIREMVSDYFTILIWGAPASLGAFVVSGWFLGQKDARTPMRVAFVINISNIVISLLLVYGFGMKISGVALGTLCAQWLGFIVAISAAIRKYRPQAASAIRLFEPQELKRFFSININIFFRTLCLIAVTVWFTRTGSSQGTDILAVNTLLMQFFTLFSYFMDGFAFAGESLCGNYIGKKDSDGLRATVSALFRWSILMVAIFTLVYALAGNGIMTLLSDDPGVILSSKEFFAWVIAIPAVGFAAFTWDGIFIGATRTREMLMSIAAATAIYFITYTLLFPELGNHGLWIAFLAYLLTRGLVLTLLRHRLYKL
ncbi:MAG: MATE family efflux transporter [Duncaniella sp.]|uniref:MATE family efflux transporter n=1 Tax=Duncaniella sp. TaxID=2518496 RepID=UPI0023D06727|nr:MATE family efflux transporter [Duncaniella sp.]MDE6089311.1 MATE family efflux transporter [Duncaniella sp.]